MTHYTCTECRGESDVAKVCETPDCLKKGQDLTACECTDGHHAGESDESEDAHH